MQDAQDYGLDGNAAMRLREQMERAEREEREWREARLHHALHGSWLSADECATCLEERDQ